MNAKALIFAAVVACAFADEAAPKDDDRVKKDVLLGTYPYGYAAVPSAYAAVPSAYGAVPSTYAAVPSTYLYDDGKYYPGKYERTYVASHAVHTVPAVSTYAAAVPTYSAVPSVHYPSYVAAGYPYVKSYVY